MKNFAVIGNPIEHSMSPTMHQWIFDCLGIDAEYKKIKVNNNLLPKIIQKLKSGDLDGINITIPLKETVLTFLDQINPRAKSIGAVNCIMISDSRIIGNNTDWYGFLLALQKNNIDLANRDIIIIGAGGVSKAIYYAINTLDVNSIKIFNRTESKINKMSLNDKTEGFRLDLLDEKIHNESVLINCTSIGLIDNRCPVRKKSMHKNQIIIDTIYNPLETSFVKLGKEIGAKSINGLDMFIFQGLLSHELWFGEKIINKVNFDKIKSYLERKIC